MAEVTALGNPGWQGFESLARNHQLPPLPFLTASGTDLGGGWGG